MTRFLQKNRIVILYGASLAAIMFLLKWLELRFVIMDHAFEVYVAAIALVFTGLGIWLALKLTKRGPQTIIVEKEVFIYKEPQEPADRFLPDEKALIEHGISKREWEVLDLMAQGLSNQEIAERLFVSVNTVKTHSSNLFQKLDVKRRTQATEKGKRLGLLA